MKHVITSIVCLAVGIGVGWYFGYTRPAAKDQRDLLAQYKYVRDNFHLTDAEMAEFGQKVPQYFEDVKRQDEEAARFALGAIGMLENGDVDRARSRLLMAVGSYYRVYHGKGGDTNLLAKIEDAAKKYPAVAAEISRKMADPPKIDKDMWHPITRKLDEAAKFPGSDDAASTLAHDLKAFYQFLHDKQWEKTYELRAKVFRELEPEPAYLAEAKSYEKIWGLVNYEVLSVGFQKMMDSTNFDEATLICKFTELPGYEVSYSTVYWHKEDGIWKCLSAGPIKLPIFRARTPPIIDWR